MDKYKMKVLHIATEDSKGAGRAARRICDAIREEGIDSSLYVLNTSSNSNAKKIEIGRRNRIYRHFADFMNAKKLAKYEVKGFFSGEHFGPEIMNMDEFTDADIIHLHWINNGIWSWEFAKELLKLNKKIVWTMHDMWPFTGGCHYDQECRQYKEGCGRCPLLSSNQKKDLSYKEAEFKQTVFEKMDVSFVGCSQWITQEARQSFICKKLKRPCSWIPNPIGPDVFRIRDKKECRKLLDIQSGKKLIVFGAVFSTTDERKGYKYLLEALDFLNPEEYLLGIFGSSHIERSSFDKFEVVELGMIEDDLHLSIVYNAANVFVAPSLQENLANTVMESLMCGTPVVAFKIGGMPDMIQHCQNGYLAKERDAEDLAKGMQMLCSIDLNSNKIHDDVVERFSKKKIAGSYIKLYQDMLEA